MSGLWGAFRIVTHSFVNYLRGQILVYSFQCSLSAVLVAVMLRLGNDRRRNRSQSKNEFICVSLTNTSISKK